MHSANAIHTEGPSFEFASSEPLFAGNVRPQPLHARLWAPSASRPFLTSRAPAPRVAVRLLRKAGDLVGYRGLEVGEQLQLLLVRELQHELRYDAFHSPSFLRWLPGKSIVREDLLPACPATGSLARICQWWFNIERIGSYCKWVAS